MRHRVAQRADAELQRAAIGNGARDMDAGGVLGEIDGLARRREQGKVGGRALQEQVELLFRYVAIAGHEGQLRIDLPNEKEIALFARPGRQQIEREVGVAAQAQSRLAAALAPGDELRDHVHPAREHIAQGMGVVRGNIILLRGGDAEPRAGLEEKLIDRDVGCERARSLRRAIGELRVAGEDAIRERLHEAPFEARRPARRLQCERGEDVEPDRGIVRRAGKQGIGDVIGLAEAERQRQHEVPAHAIDDGIGDAVRIVEPVGAAAAAFHVRPMK